MTILKIKMFPDKILRQKAEHIKNIDKEILKLLDNMAETMYNALGIGLAANQVGYHMFDRRMESAVLPYCKDNNIEMLWNLGGGKIQSSSDLIEQIKR